MKKIGLLLVTLFVTTACTKDKTEPKSPIINNPVPIRIPKNLRIVSTNSLGGIDDILKTTFTYNSKKQLITTLYQDSTRQHLNWVYGEWNETRTYNSFDKVSQIKYLSSTTNYFFDANQKLIYTVDGQSDTLRFNYSGNIAFTKRCNMNGCTINYYSHDLDSMLTLDINNKVTSRTVYLRNSTEDLLYKYTNQFEPLIINTHEITSIVTNFKTTTYSRTYDQQAYPLTETTTNPNYTVVTSIFYE